MSAAQATWQDHMAAARNTTVPETPDLGGDDVWATPSLRLQDEDGDVWASHPQSAASAIETSPVLPLDTPATTATIEPEASVWRKEIEIDYELDIAAELDSLDTAFVARVKLERSADVPDVCYDPLSVDEVRSTWLRLTKVAIRRRAFADGPIDREMRSILQAWQAREKAKASWEQRPTAAHTVAKNQESIGAGLFGWNAADKEVPLVKRYSGIPSPLHRPGRRTRPSTPASHATSPSGDRVETRPRAQTQSAMSSQQGTPRSLAAVAAPRTTVAQALRPSNRRMSTTDSAQEDSFGDFQNASIATEPRQPPQSTLHNAANEDPLAEYRSTPIRPVFHQNLGRQASFNLLMLSPTETRSAYINTPQASHTGTAAAPAPVPVEDDFGDFQDVNLSMQSARPPSAFNLPTTGFSAQAHAPKVPDHQAMRPRLQDRSATVFSDDSFGDMQAADSAPVTPVAAKFQEMVLGPTIERAMPHAQAQVQTKSMSIGGGNRRESFNLMDL